MTGDIRAMLGIKPGEANRLALERELRRRVEAWDRPGFFYRGSADLLLQHGQFFPGREIPEAYVDLMGMNGACFDNAAGAAEQRPELRCFQGVYSAGAGHFTPHGWCVAPDGGVVELTWPTRDLHPGMVNARANMPIAPPDRVGYWGVEIRPELMWWADERYDNHCLLDRPAADFLGEGHYTPAMAAQAFAEAKDLPLLRYPYDPTRVSF